MRYVSCSLLTLLSCLPLAAQEVTAGIYGTVQDSSSAVIANAEVTLRNVDTGREYKKLSDGTGNYVLTLIPLGSYEVTAESTGFKKATVTGLTLNVNDNRRVDFKLQVGQMADSVSVTADAVLVNTANGTTESVIPEKTIQSLPSTGRAVAPFALLMPGAVTSAAGTTSASANYTSVNGLRPTHNAWTLDGGYDIDTGGNWSIFLPPNMEIIAEVNAIRQNYSAEFGTGGGSQFNMITKSGTNDLHGSAYEFVQNNAFEARQFFQPTIPVLKYNDFGFTTGGPAWIPKIYNGRNKTFFFVNVDWTWQGTATQFLQIVPTLAQRTGDYSGTSITVKDPKTGLPFPNNIIPSTRIDPNAALYAGLYPAPNYRDSIGDNWDANQPGRNHHRQYTLRGDHNFTDKHRLTARWTADHVNNSYGTASGFAFLRETDNNSASHLVIDETSTFQPNLINDFNFVRISNRLIDNRGTLSPSQTGINIPELFPITAETYPLSQLALSSIPQRIPGISLTNYASIAPGTPWANYERIYDVKDNLVWIRGAHTIKLGFDFTHEEKSEPTVTDVWGIFTFNGSQTGDSFADMLLGNAASFTESNTVAYNDNLRESYEGYVDDSWKVLPRLTVDVGVRYSLFQPAHEADNKYRVFDPAAYNPATAVTVNSAGQIVAGSGNTMDGLVNPDGLWKYSRHNFAPRVGFAYDPKGDGKTAIRGGFGMFYSREILGAFILMSGNPPFQQQALVYNVPLSNPGSGTTAAATPVTLGSNNLNQLTPYTVQYNLNIQRTLTSDLILEVGYSGTRGIHMMRTVDINQPLPQAGIAQGLLSANAFRPYAGYGIIQDRQQSYASKYNALQTSLMKRLSHGVLFKANYTWSKSLDDTDCCSGNIYNPIPNTYNGTNEWGRSSFDAEHAFIGDVVWAIPFLSSRNDLLGKTLGGWQLSGILTLQTSLPVDALIGADRAGVGSAQGQRPQVTCNPNLGFGDRTVSGWFNPACFTLPTYGTFANTGRNILNGPGLNNLDASLHKNFRVTERINLEFRADAFNPLNHTEFNAIGRTITTPSQFGKVISAKNARNLMFGMRLSW
jgi:hypothetical protein